MAECKTMTCKNVSINQPESDYEIHCWRMDNEYDYKHSRIGQTIQWMYKNGYDKNIELNFVFGTCQRLMRDKIIK
jgi:hypothetical protein